MAPQGAEGSSQIPRLAELHFLSQDICGRVQLLAVWYPVVSVALTIHMP